ncbi:MAG: serine/threonine-protein kinase, partial [Planctomycetota bacterium]
MPDRDAEQQFVQTALDRGMLNSEQLQQAIHELSARRGKGSSESLGDVLVAMKFLTREQVQQLTPGPAQQREQIPGFVLLKKLGEGGMGSTYLARQTAVDRQVALKVLRRDYSRDPEYIARFQHEARLAGKLDHPGIVHVITVGEFKGLHYMAMEYVEGSNLLDLMPDAGTMDESKALGYVRQVAKALDYAHGQEVVHRDVKPDNVLVTPAGVAKLCDFGLAKKLGGSVNLTQSGMAVGTPNYISPEQARGRPDVDIRGDIYSLGCTLYQLVTGETPFTGANGAVLLTKHLNEQAPWPQDVNPDASKNVSLLIERMMAKDREERYQTPAELLADIERVIAGQRPTHPAPSGQSSVAIAGAVQPQPRPQVRRRPRRGRRPSSKKLEVPPAAKAKKRAARPSRPPLSKTTQIVYGGGAVLGLLLLSLVVMYLGGQEKYEPPPSMSEVLRAERDAQMAWKGGLEHFLAREGLSAEEGKQLNSTIETFKRNHGNTEFRKSRAEDLGRLEVLARIAVAGGAKARDLEVLYQWAERLRAENPEDYRASIGRFRSVLKFARDKEWAAKIKAAIARIEADLAQAADAEFAECKEKAGKLYEVDDVDGALEALSRPREKFRSLLAARLEAEKTALRAETTSRYRAAFDAAKRLSEEGEPVKALAELEKVSAIRYAPWGGRMVAMRIRLEREREDPVLIDYRRRRTTARKLAVRVLETADGLLVARSYGEALALMDRETAGAPENVREFLIEDFGIERRMADKLSSYRAARKRRLTGLVGRAVRLRDRAGKLHDVRVLGVGEDGFEVEYDYTTLGYRKS